MKHRKTLSFRNDDWEAEPENPFAGSVSHLRKGNRNGSNDARSRVLRARVHG